MPTFHGVGMPTFSRNVNQELGSSLLTYSGKLIACTFSTINTDIQVFQIRRKEHVIGN